MSSSAIRSLARRLDRLESGALKTKQPTLGFSSIDDGAITSVDEDQNLKMIFGKQFDGTQTSAVLSGPNPPAPTGPFVNTAPSGLKIYWDGTFADGQVAPMDFTRVTIHAEPSAGFGGTNPLDQTHIVGEFNSARGGEVFASLPIEEHVVYLVTWTQAGNFSTPSDIDFGTPTAIDGIPDLEAPTSSPGLSVTGTAEGFILQAEDVLPTTRIEYHVSSISGFTPDSTTLIVPATRETVAFFTNGSDASGPYNLDTTYYFKTVATNDVGSASPSSETASVLDPTAITEQITARLVAGFILAGSIQVGQITIDAETGITIPQASGGEIRLPADGSAAIFSGKVRTDDLTVETNAVFNGLSHIVGELRLLTGIPNPTNLGDPLLTWPSVEDDRPAGLRWGGLDYTDNGQFYFTVEWQDQGTGTLYSVEAATGAVVGTTNLGGSIRIFGLTCRGSQVHVLLYDYINQVLQYRTWNINETTGAFVGFVGRFDVTLGESRHLTGWPCIGNNGLDLWIIYRRAATGTMRLDRIDPSTGTFISGTSNRIFLDTDAGEMVHVASLKFGTFDFGADRIVVSSWDDIPGFSQPNWVFDLTGARQTANTWDARSTGAIAWDGERFWELDEWTQPRLWKYSKRPLADTRYFSYTWYDDNPTNGTHESEASPVDPASGYVPRAFLRFDAPRPPQYLDTEDDSANRVRVYIGSTSDTSTHRLVSGALTLADNYSITLDTADIPATSAPPTVNGFAALGTSGRISGGGVTDPIIDLNGQGNGRVSGLTFTGVDWQLESDLEESGSPWVDLRSVSGFGRVGPYTYQADGGGSLGPLAWDGAGKATGFTSPNDFTASPTHADMTGSLRFREILPGVVVMFGHIDVDVGIGTSPVDTGIDIPLGLRPAAQEIIGPYNYYNSSNQYRYWIRTSGQIDFQQSGVDSTFATVSAIYFID